MRAVEEIRAELIGEAEETGYKLNPDREMLDDIIEGLSVNEERYGYLSCPCRIALGDHMSDLDIVCPCEYRDPDLEEYGRCYCALYVTQSYIDAGMPPDPIPERRTDEKRTESVEGIEADEADAAEQAHEDEEAEISADDVEVDKEDKADVDNQIEVWRCGVCGYLCARTEPPRICPICRAKRERFREFSFC
jgi:ferredoxin-thioredoxin reductase catalytic subunit